MSGIDYVSCRCCRKRLFYDGDYVVRDYMIRTNSTKEVTCDHCVTKLEKKLAKAIKAYRK